MRDQAARLYVEVSPEMTLLMGPGSLNGAPLPPEPLIVGFDVEGVATITIEPFDAAKLEADHRLLLIVQHSAFERVGGFIPDDAERGFHQSSTLRGIIVAIRDSALTGEALTVYRLGKSLELLCETISLLGSDDLVPVAHDGVLSLDDARRVVNARRMIDERWSEKLTLDKIARACGLNRAKLTRGFREMFNCTIAEALAEQRLLAASRMLLTTDLPVGSIGYENGYLNNASFARAFSRRFGVSPSSFRACQAAA